MRDLGVAIGVHEPGAFGAITDVAGVRVGHRTLIEGERVRTGVTAIAPHGGNLFQEKVPAAVVVGDGFGKLMGSIQVQELGEIETPILLTNTLAVPQVSEGVIRRTLPQPTRRSQRSLRIAERSDDSSVSGSRRSDGRGDHQFDAARPQRAQRDRPC